MPFFPGSRAAFHTSLLARSTACFVASPHSPPAVIIALRSDSITSALATSPAFAPPMPSETASRTASLPASKLTGLAASPPVGIEVTTELASASLVTMNASSLFVRTRPGSVWP